MKKPSLSLQDTGRIYLDHNATTPPLHSVLERLPDWAKSWGNPSSIHWSGRGPKNIIRTARASLAQTLNCHPLEIIFTSGGSESNNYVIKGVFESTRESNKNNFITSNVEHPSVMKCFKMLETWGAKVHYVSVNRQGKIDLDEYKKALSEDVALVSIMAANNETGSVFPVKEMAKMAHEAGALFHTDAVQALGKLPVDLNDWGVDFATFASHKVYSLKGAGLVFARKGRRVNSLILGGAQERSRRAGTENLLSIAAFGHVAERVKDFVSLNNIQTRRLRDELEQQIRQRISGVQWTGAGVERLPNTSSLLIDGIDGESLLMSLDLEGVAVSTGAACSSGNPEPSPVLLAMGLSRAEAQRSLRLSLGVDTQPEHIDKFLDILERVVLRLRSLHPERSSRAHDSEL